MASTKIYGPLPTDGTAADIGYRIVERSPGSWRWIWSEPGEEDWVSAWYSCESSAFAAAAEDWEVNGDGGKLSATLRAQATRLCGLGR